MTILRQGQVHRTKKSHTCLHCGREIWKGERAYVKAVIVKDETRKKRGFVVVRYSCCKEIK